MVDHSLMESRKSKSRRLDYKMESSQFSTVHFLFECGYKLKCSPETLTVAATIVHKFWRATDGCSGYDCYLVALGCLRLAGKSREARLRSRDLVNVGHRTLNRGPCAPLDMGPDFWSRMEALGAVELLILRILKFRLFYPSSYIYLLHYLKSLRGIVPKNVWDNIPVAQSAVAFHQDIYHSQTVLDFLPDLIAVGCIELALQVYGVRVPFTTENEPWYFTIMKKANQDDVWKVMETVMDVYSALK